ncbi:MAG: hypothetical protein LBC20_13845 [Planctomycetaceae bacterium]|nr:hypothetical protein [Planctomycetaceae bacterium]
MVNGVLQSVNGVLQLVNGVLQLVNGVLQSVEVVLQFAILKGFFAGFLTFCEHSEVVLFVLSGE